MTRFFRCLIVSAMMGRFVFPFGLSICGVLAFAGCSTTVQNHGWVGEQAHIEKVKKNKLTFAQTKELLGPPTLFSALSPGSVYYISYKTTQGVSFLRPKVSDYCAHKLSFTKQGAFKDAVSLTQKDLVEVSPLSRETPSHGNETPFFKQVFRNLGQLGNKQKL